MNVDSAFTECLGHFQDISNVHMHFNRDRHVSCISNNLQASGVGTTGAPGAGTPLYFLVEV